MKAIISLAVSFFFLFSIHASADVFETGTTYPDDPYPVGAVVQDLNNDQVADIVTADSATGDISVFRGLGDGTFGPARGFSVGAPVAGIASADLNGDGSADLVVTVGFKSVYISLGKGDGTFASATGLTLPTKPTGIAIADFNGDGNMDIAIAGHDVAIDYQGNVALLIGQGDGTFAKPVLYSLDHHGERLVAADLNGDGELDLAVALERGVAVLLGNGDGTFEAATTISPSDEMADIAAADLNGDGKIDLALAPKRGRKIEVFLGNGDGTFAAAVKYEANSSTATVSAIDLNGDGKLDLLVGGAPIATLLGKGDGTFGKPTLYAIGRGIAVPGFFNRDEVPDVVAGGSSGITVAFGNPNGTFRAPRAYLAGYLAGSVVSADFDRDGKLDLAVGGETVAPTITLLLGDGLGRFRPGKNLGTVPAEMLATADFNNDGNADLLSSSYSGGSILVYLGNGDGTFGQSISTTVPNADLGPTVGDLNHDGIPDVVVARLQSNALRVLIGNGDGTFTNAGDLHTDKSPQVPLISDFNGDGNADIAVSNVTGDTVGIYLGNGDGTFQAAIPTDAPNAIYSAAADVNGDGKMDLVVASLGTKLYLGNGDGTFQMPQSLLSEYGPTQIADIDGDGKLDVAVTNSISFSSTIEILRGNGDGTFGRSSSVETGSGLVGYLIVQDLSGDGAPDIAVTNISDAVAVILNTGRPAKGF